MLGDVIRKAKAVWGEFSRVGAGTYAASTAYFTFLSLAPLIALCISLVSMLGIGEQEVTSFFAALVPSALSPIVQELVQDAFANSGIAFSLSTVTLLWSASKGVRALRNGLNAAYGVEESRNGLWVAAISIFAVIIMGALLVAAMYIVFSSSVSDTLAEAVPGLQKHDILQGLLDCLVTMLLGALMLDVCYTLLPAGKRSFRAQLPGAAIASFACGALSFGFRIYVEHFSNFTVLYGGIATVALFLFWMYLVSYILVAGGFVNRVLAHEDAPDPAN